MTVWPDAITAMEPSIVADAALPSLVHAELLSMRQRAGCLVVGRSLATRAAARDRLRHARARRRSAMPRRRRAMAHRRRRARRRGLGRSISRATGDGRRAAEHLLAAARKALREGANTAAVAHAERGLSSSDFAAETGAHLHSIAAAATHRAGHYDASLEHSARGLALSAVARAHPAVDGTARLDAPAHRPRARRCRASSRRARAADRARRRGGRRDHLRRARVYVELEGAWADVQRMEFDRAGAARHRGAREDRRDDGQGARARPRATRSRKRCTARTSSSDRCESTAR